jgi:hypothetical protein
MIEFTLTAHSSAPAEDVLAAARDFSRRRIEIWPNVSARRYEVHASGEMFAEVTEGALQGLFWERTRYEWPRPGRVHQTVLDSNVLRPGSTWEITAVPNGDGCQVECVFRHELTRTPKGRIGWAINRFASRPVYGFDLRRALAAIEGQSRRGQR